MSDDTNAGIQTQTEVEFDSELTEQTNTERIPSTGLHCRRSHPSSPPASSNETLFRRNNLHEEPNALSPCSNLSDGASIAGLHGLDEEYRIGNRQNSEDEIREVQLRALTRRIMASPSLVLFPARKADIDVL
jgi:hypothetical protein